MFSFPPPLASCLQLMGLYLNDDDSTGDDDSFWCREEGQSCDLNINRGLPSTTASRTFPKEIVNKPKPVYLRDQLQDSASEAGSLSVPRKAPSEFVGLSNGLISDTIELPSIPPEWKCCRSPETNLCGEILPCSNQIIQTCVSHILACLSLL